MTRLLFQLTRRSLLRRLTCLGATGRKVVDDATNGVSILARENHAAIIGERHGGHCVGWTLKINIVKTPTVFWMFE